MTRLELPEGYETCRFFGSGDEYMEELLRRQAAYEAAHPPRSGVPSWLRPLLEWFIHPDDQVVGVNVDVKPAAPKPNKPVRKEDRPFLEARMERNRASLAVAKRNLAELIGEPKVDWDPAMINLPIGKRPGASLTDSKLEKWRYLTQRISALESKLALDQARLDKLTAKGE